MSLFGQVLASMYQDDIIEADDIRAWHRSPQSQGQGLPSELEANYKKCWDIGNVMLQHLDTQESEEESEESDEDEGEAEDEDEVQAEEEEEQEDEESDEDGSSDDTDSDNGR